MKPLRIFALIVGTLISLAGLALLTGSIALGAVLATEPDDDDDGYFSSSTERFTTATYAFTSQEIDFAAEPGPTRWWADHDLATVRVSANMPPGATSSSGSGPSGTSTPTWRTCATPT